jgi:hypothetical protein
LYSAAAGALNVFLTLQTAQMLFQYTHIPTAFQLENPDASDAAIEDLMAQESTLQSVSDAMGGGGTEMAKMFAKALSEAYGQPFDDKAFDARVAEADRQIAEDPSDTCLEG